MITRSLVSKLAYNVVEFECMFKMKNDISSQSVRLFICLSTWKYWLFLQVYNVCIIIWNYSTTVDIVRNVLDLSNLSKHFWLFLWHDIIKNFTIILDLQLVRLYKMLISQKFLLHYNYTDSIRYFITGFAVTDSAWWFLFHKKILFWLKTTINIEIDKICWGVVDTI